MLMDKINKVINGNCIDEMNKIGEESIDFIMFSPPYDADKEYEEKLGEKKYTNFLKEILIKSNTVLSENGRIAIVVPFRCGQKSGQWSRLYAVMRALNYANFNIRDLIVWNQNDIQGTSWGSWCSPSAPNIQYQTEYMVIGYKNEWKRDKDEEGTITNQEFKNWTISNIWGISPDTNSPHPAPYPEELVERCIKLFTYPSDIVMDPMAGSGTTLVVSKRLGRNFLGIEIDEKYCDIARKRLINTAPHPDFKKPTQSTDGQQSLSVWNKDE